MTFVKPPLPQEAGGYMAGLNQSVRIGAPIYTAEQMQARDDELLRAVADWLVEVQTERQHGEWNTLPAEVIDELRKAAVRRCNRSEEP